MKNIDWGKVPDPVDLPRLKPGGYVCKITLVTDEPKKEYLKVEYDIAEGEFKGHWNELYKAKSFWGGTFIRSYKETALSMFKGFLTAVKESNPGFIFNNEEKRLEGQLIGLVLGEEEYRKNNGTDGTRLYVAAVRSVDKIRKGDFTIPPKKLLANGTSDGWSPVDDAEADEVPF